VIPVSRFAASRRTCWQSSARGAVNATWLSKPSSSSTGGGPTDNEVAVLVRESRADKLTEISTRDLRKEQQERLTPDEARTLGAVRGAARLTSVAVDPSAPSLEHAVDHIFERVSVASEDELLTEALRHGRGRIRLADLKGELNLQESTGKILRSGREVATAMTLERERHMIGTVNRGLGAFEPLGGTDSSVVFDRLRAEQKQAVEFVLQSRDRAISISGAAGTGKTATLEGLRRALMDAGREVLAVAPTMSAVEELQKVGFADAITVERLQCRQRCCSRCR
jgi:primosomal protein N'